MAKAYWTACYRSVANPDALAAYAELAGPVAAYGGAGYAAAVQTLAGTAERDIRIVEGVG